MTRIGLVLGAGGVVGHAWHAGALAGLALATKWDPREAEIVVGTSAGSGVGALLRGGLPAADLAAQQTGEGLSPEGARLAARMARAGPFSADRSWPAPALIPPRALLGAMTGRVRLGALIATGVGRGRVPTTSITAMVDSLLPNWPARAFWACSVNASSGRLHVVGRERPEPCSPGVAVAASCAIPGYFEPVEIGGRPHVDGGAHSTTNADTLAGHKLDAVVVLAPMLGVEFTMPGAASAALNLLMRRRVTAELARLERDGVRCVLLTPAAADLAAMGGNLMDPGRRAATARAARESAAGSEAARFLRDLLASAA